MVVQKTGHPVAFEIRASLLAWLQRRGATVEDYAFPSRVDHTDHLCTRQYGQLVDKWVTAIGLRREDYGAHSLRRTKAAMIYKATGSLRAIQILLGHTKIENTVRYLGVDIEDALELPSGLKSEAERPCAVWGRPLSLRESLPGCNLLCSFIAVEERIPAVSTIRGSARAAWRYCFPRPAEAPMMPAIRIDV
ncbi:tyrosine-type recombinase/integrase [Ensifer sp. ENS04]|uniref:tyrosine-type recombinase/integrase n=1 Tax=Ensifer sp. ENS04 TaxID=2769281 RepID=UPI001FEF3594|nr:tyrosine-type recombinase/integrase [Ensifer sp. ENS04]